MPALLVGILKAGAAYVPLDPDYPIARLSDMVEDSRVQVVLAHRAQEHIVESFGVPVIFADEQDQISRHKTPITTRQRADLRSNAAGLRDLHVWLDRKPQRGRHIESKCRELAT